MMSDIKLPLSEHTATFGELMVGRLFQYQATYIKTSKKGAVKLGLFLTTGDQTEYPFQPDVEVSVILVERPEGEDEGVL